MKMKRCRGKREPLYWRPPHFEKDFDLRIRNAFSTNSKGNMSPHKSCFLSPFRITIRAIRFVTIFVTIAAGLLFRAHGQVNVVTYHNDVARTGSNANETLLTPANVNRTSFGLRFTQPVDGYIVGQPLYLSNVTIPNAGVHNVVYVATLNDSVYAFDADSNTGSNAAPLWHVNFTNLSAGITTASGEFLPCQAVTLYNQSGIVSTPVMDPSTGTMYVVAKTNENGTVVHRLYALDVTTGEEKFSPPVAMEGSFTANDGTVRTLQSLHAMNRPALLLENGIVYIAFGSNGCNDQAYGWVLAYDATALTPAGIFNAAPAKGLASIWHSGSGPAADSAGNIYISTAEADFSANLSGQDFGSSILKLVQEPGTLVVDDYFTPYNTAYISEEDLDLSASGPVVLPDQPGPNPHLLVASGKQGTIYLLDRDNMGHFNPVSDTQIVQELPFAVGAMFSTPAYWNNTVYFAGNAHPVEAYALNNGLLLTPPVAKSVTSGGGHSPTISANGNSDGLVWVINGSALFAMDALSLKTLYATNQAGTRDVLPALAHFATQTVANGAVFVGTQTKLMAYGLLPRVAVVSGNNQTATVTAELPLPLQVEIADPYTGQTFPGVSVTFSDGGKGGTFGNTSVVTDATGTATTTYTFGKVARSLTITASSTGMSGATFAETATPAKPEWVLPGSGVGQTAQVTTSLPAPVMVRVADLYGNDVPGQSVTFSDGSLGGSFSANPVTTNNSGNASTIYTTSTKAGSFNLIATLAGCVPRKLSETATAGPAAIVNVIAGNNQTGPVGAALPQELMVQVTDQYGNPVPNVSISFSDGGSGGTFSAPVASTDNNGEAGSLYTPPAAGTFYIVASAGTGSATFTETAQ